MMSLYGQYIRELGQGDIVETEYGFATYFFTEANECYIQDIYIVPEARKQHKASDIAAIIENVARKKGCIRLLGSVVPTNKGSTASIKVLLAYGFHLKSASQNFLLFEKGL